MKFSSTLGALVFFAATTLHAATFTVMNASDTGAGSLRAALASAAGSGGADTVDFDASLSGQTIALTSGSLGTSDAGGVTVDASALPGGITLNSGGASRVFRNSSGGVLTLRGVTLANGFNASGGGAIQNDSATLTMERCTITGSTSGIGGGVLTETGSTTTLKQCTFSGNTATTQGGAIYNRGTTSLIHCTVRGNTAQQDGGGIYNQTGFTLTLENSIVAGNTATTTGPDVLNFGTLTRVGASIVQAGVTGSGTVNGGGTINAADPLLSALGNFGGPTRVMLPGAGSPAIDQAVSSAETMDQRGFPRPVDIPSSAGTASDIGAVEVQLPDANLSNLVLSAGTLSPAFAAATTSYTSMVPFGTANLNVTPTASNANATITVNNTAVASGAQSGNIALNTGPNPITIVVTAPDGAPVKTYTVTVYRPNVAGEIFVTSASDTGPGSVRDVFDTVNDAFNTNPTYTTINLTGVTSSSGATFNPYPLLRPKGGTVTIEGGGTGVLNGGGASRPIFIYSGNVTLRNLTLANTKAFGGNATGGGGGGAGLGGAIFIYKGANVTAENVTFSASSATGGNGGDDGGAANSYYVAGGGGGGMGGNGGLVAGFYTPGTGGGGLGGDGGLGGGGIRSGALTAQGGGSGADGGFFGPLGGARGASDTSSIQSSGKDGGGGSGPTFAFDGSAGGGGLAGYWAPAPAGGGSYFAAPHTINGGWGGGGGGGGGRAGYLIGSGGAGGFGGGGGGGGSNGGNDYASGGPGGFGGGGGGSSDADATGGGGGQYASGGAGGFGGGGGAGGLGQDGIGGGGAGGFGAGNGGSGNPGAAIRRCGGGGLGAGGAVFVMAGATFTAIDPVFTGAFSVTGGAAGGPGAGAGQGIGAGLFLGGNATIQVSNNTTVTLPNVPDFIGGGADPEASGKLIVAGAALGTLVMTNSNSYTGGTELFSGVLAVSNDNQLGGSVNGVPGGITFGGGVLTVTGTSFTTTARNVALLPGAGARYRFTIADAGHTFTLSQPLGGAGGLSKSGPGTLVLTSSPSYAGTTSVNQGTVRLDNGLGSGGDTLTVAAAGTLLAKGNVGRRITGAGTITANNAALSLGDLADANGFNFGGTLNVGNSQVVLLSQSKAVLGAQTNLLTSGTLVTVNGLQLGGAATVDPSKVLSATSAATIQGAFTNNGVVHGPTGAGQNLVLQNLVNGAGNFTGNVVFNGGYSPGNSPATVTLQNATFAPVNVLTMELGGTAPGTDYDHLNITGSAKLGGAVVVTLVNGFTPAPGNTFDLIDGPTTGAFANLVLPDLPMNEMWDTSQFATNGTITVIGLNALQTWRRTHFGGTANSGAAADLFDGDKDGLVNLVEFAFGQNPTLASSRQLPQLEKIDGNLRYRFTEPAGVSGVTYGAEWSATLRADDWHIIPDTGTPPEHLFILPAGTSDRMFMRFKITDP
jgi:predicted outer membrane repeat protein